MIVLPDVERLLIDFLDSEPEVAGIEFHTEFPADPEFPLVVLGRSGGIPTVRYWLDRARVAFDCYGETRDDAWDTALRAHAALELMPGLSHAEGVVNGVEDTLGFQWIPLPENARPRVTFEVAITLHPGPAGS